MAVSVSERMILVSIKTLTKDTSPPAALLTFQLLLHPLALVGLFSANLSSV